MVSYVILYFISFIHIADIKLKITRTCAPICTLEKKQNSP